MSFDFHHLHFFFPESSVDKSPSIGAFRPITYIQNLVQELMVTEVLHA